jgi:PAS domain S-box-containing protein
MRGNLAKSRVAFCLLRSLCPALPVLARPSRRRETWPLYELPPSSERREVYMPPSLRPEHVLATILSSTEEGLLSFSLDGTIQSWSGRAEQLYGYAAAEITRRSVTMLLPIYQVPACQEFLRAVKEDTFPCCENTERLRKDGSRIRVELKRAAVRDETGSVMGILETASAEDLHAQSRAAEGHLPSCWNRCPRYSGPRTKT